MRSSLLVALLAAAACLAHAGAESAAPAPRRSLAVDLSPTDPRSDLDWCWDSLLTLGLWCKQDLLAGRPAPRACCRAADEAVHHCGPFTRAFLGSLLPLGPLAKCAHPVITDAPAARRPRARAPPRAPALETGGGRVPSGAQPPPPSPEARTDALSPPPRVPTGASSGTPGQKPEMSARFPPLPTAPPTVPSGTPKRPPRSSVRIPPPEAPRGTQGSPGPKPQTTTRAPALPGGARDDGSPPKSTVIAGGSAGGRRRRAPDAYAAGAGTPLAAAGAAPPPQKGLPVQ